jgi:hypothetical protein
VKNCSEFDRWLDQGRPKERAAAAEAHASTCARCARTLAAELAIVAAFALPVGGTVEEPAAPVGFTDRVMARVAASNATRRSLSPTPANDLPWWVSAAAEPVTVFAALLAALVLWQPKVMMSAALSFARLVMNGVGQNPTSRRSAGSDRRSPA